MSKAKYTPRPEHKFSFGLWTVGNRGRDPGLILPIEPQPFRHTMGALTNGNNIALILDGHGDNRPEL